VTVVCADSPVAASAKTQIPCANLNTVSLLVEL
jgi:hypothetical protein